MSTYSEKLKDPRWQKKRLKILSRDRWKCKKCGDTETTLHVHHLNYNGNPWEVENEHLITLCEDCHECVESIHECKCEFKDIKIFKSDSWSDGSRIMFMSFDGIVSMRIYNGKDEFIIGFELYFGMNFELIKILRNAIKWTKNNAGNG